MSGVSRRVAVDGLELHARLEGHGPPIVLLHGFTGSAATLQGVADGLRDTYRTVGVDLVGHGESAAPRAPDRYCMERCVEDLIGLLDALGLDRPHLLGYSLGGRTALCVAAAHPERVASLTLIGASAGIADPVERQHRVRADEALAASILRDGLEAFVQRWMALPLFATQARLGADFLAQTRAQRLRNRPHALALSLRGMGTGAQPALHAQLPRVRLPVLCVAGEDDPKFCALADDLAVRLPDARVCRIPRAGHAAHLENPPAFLAALRRFLGEVTGPEASRRRVRRGAAASAEGVQR